MQSHFWIRAGIGFVLLFWAVGQMLSPYVPSWADMVTALLAPVSMMAVAASLLIRPCRWPALVAASHMAVAGFCAVLWLLPFGDLDDAAKNGFLAAMFAGMMLVYAASEVNSADAETVG